jgi:hypothetical protein
MRCKLFHSHYHSNHHRYSGQEEPELPVSGTHHRHYEIQAHQAPNPASEVEDRPEEEDILPLGRFGRVGHHDLALSAPKHACTAPQDEASRYNVAEVLREVVAEVGRDIDAVPNATEGECDLDAQGVCDRSSEEPDYRKGCVQGAVRGVTCFRCHLACTADAVQSIEHALVRVSMHKNIPAINEPTWAKKAHKSDQEQLRFGRGVVWQSKKASVLPTLPRVSQLVQGRLCVVDRFDSIRKNDFLER